MVEKLIKSMKTMGLKTRVEFVSLEKNEVRRVGFEDEAEYEKMIKARFFIPANEDQLIEWQDRNIPILTDDPSPESMLQMTLPEEDEAETEEPKEDKKEKPKTDEKDEPEEKTAEASVGLTIGDDIVKDTPLKRSGRRSRKRK